MEAVIVSKPEATIVDLMKVSADHARVLAELRQVHAAIHGKAIAKLIWMMPPHLLAYYIDGDDDPFSELFEEIGAISYGRATFMTFLTPPNVGIRIMLQQYGITPISAEPAES